MVNAPSPSVEMVCPNQNQAKAREKRAWVRRRPLRCVVTVLILNVLHFFVFAISRVRPSLSRSYASGNVHQGWTKVIVKTQMHQTQAAEVSMKPKWLKHWGRRKHKH